MPPNNSSNDLLNDVGVDDVEEVIAPEVTFVNGSLSCSALPRPADDEEAAGVVGEKGIPVLKFDGFNDFCLNISKQ